MSTSDNNTNNNKKRPRPSDYYDRLLFQCQKDLHKHAKQTKQFEVQKLIRQLKCIPDDDDHAPTKKNRTALANKLQELKDYDLEPVVQECVRQLGLAALNPNLLGSSTGDDDGPSIIIAPLAPSCWMRDRIVHHTRLKATIEKWHEEVTKYRRWSLVKSEKQEAAGSKFVSRENSLFVQLGTAASSASTTTSGGRGTRTKKATAAEDRVDASYYGPAGGLLAAEDGGGNANRTKKNRQGQRARKAKALAVAARKEGRMLLPEESVNWRPAKKRPREEAVSSAGGHVREDEAGRADTRRRPTNNNDPTKQQQQHASQSDNSHNNKKNNETLHPSWQARKDKKDCIVAFQGKKITF